MNRDSDATDATRAAATGQTDPAGELRAAREALQMSVDDVAEALHLDLDIVAALDRGDFDALGAAVFVKGYLRGYARLVGLDEDRIVAGYTPAHPDPDEFRSVSMPQEVKPAFSLPLAVAWIAMGLLVLGFLIYLLSGDSADDEIAEDDFIEQPAESAAAESAGELTSSIEAALPDDFVIEESAAAVAPAAAATNPATDSSVARATTAAQTTAEADRDGEPASAAKPLAEAAPAAASRAVPEPVTITADTVRLELVFSAECWVELADARQRLLYGLEKPGSRRTFDAMLPLRFYLGDASAVQIRIADADYTIPAGVRTGRKTARFAVRAEDLRSLR